MSDAIPAVVLGASGYVGGELMRLIAGHPHYELAAAVSDSRAGSTIGDTFGHLSQAFNGVSFVAHDSWLDEIDSGSQLALFSAAPHGASASLIANALDAAGSKNLTAHVVDSSADFRYERRGDYESVYQAPHGAPELLDQFICAVPEHLDKIDAPHVGHPGCFATATLLAAVPLVRSGLTDAQLFVTGVTGSTGSGRAPQPGTHHPERNSNLYAYKPLSHRHSPEIATLSKAASSRDTSVHFVPHSGPFARGIHVTLQARAKAPVTDAELRAIFEDAYGGSPFVQLVDATPRVKNVVASNMCHIGTASDGECVVVMSAIDNLVKGAAGGAVQWMNRLWQLPETAGLTQPSPGWT